MKDLTIRENRIYAINAIENSFLMELRFNSFEISPDAVCTITGKYIDLGIAITSEMDKGFKMAFASSIQLYAINPDSFFGRKVNEINLCSSGSFNPSVLASYWRTIHAASILKNWKTASEIVNNHCKMYADLEKMIILENKL